MPITEIGTGGLTIPPEDMLSSRSDVTNKTDFLKMLVAQLTNQDPLSPMDGTDFSSQLAELSSLEELQKMSGFLDSSLEANLLLATSINNSMATTLIGKTVRAEADIATIGETGEATLNFQLESSATDVTIEIVDESGHTVRTLTEKSFSEGQNSIEWDGYDDSGNRVPAGDYRIQITAKDSEGLSVKAEAILEGRVTGITYRDGIAIIMVGSQEVSLGNIIAVMEGNSGIFPIG